MVCRCGKIDVRIYLEVTLPSIAGKDRCMEEKRNNKRKSHAEICVEKLKVMNVMANL